MSRTRDLLTGIQGLLAAATTVTGTVGPLPYDDPDQRWAVSFTNAGDDALGRWGQGILMLQTRGAKGVPLDPDDIADPLAKILAALSGSTFGTVTVNQCLHARSSSGRDASNRYTRVDRFDLDLDYSA